MCLASVQAGFGLRFENLNGGLTDKNHRVAGGVCGFSPLHFAAFAGKAKACQALSPGLNLGLGNYR